MEHDGGDRRLAPLRIRDAEDRGLAHRRVLHDDPSDLRSVGTTGTPGFRFFAAAVKPERPAGAETPIPGRLADRLPAQASPAPEDFPTYAWPVWDRPQYRIEKKEAWTVLRKAFAALPSDGVGR